jgi:hypothetical protein
VVIDQNAVIHATLDITEYYIPLESLMPNALLGGGPASRTDVQRGSDCRTDGEGWVDPGDLDAANGNRATGVEACLDSAYLIKHPGSDTNWKKVAPPGYKWARSQAGYLGNRPPGEWVNACHLLGKALSGDGLQLNNLATCARSANAVPVAKSDPGIADHMAHLEARVKKAIDSGQVVHYQVTPVYLGSRTVPQSFEITASGTFAGKPGLAFNEVVPNLMYSNKFRNWHNIGMVTYQGVPVPTGAMP